MSDWELNLTGNLAKQSADAAAKTASLTAALQAEEKALKSIQGQQARVGAGSDATGKSAKKLGDASFESRLRIATLGSELKKLTAAREAAPPIERLKKGLREGFADTTISRGIKSVGEAIKSVKALSKGGASEKIGAGIGKAVGDSPQTIAEGFKRASQAALVLTGSVVALGIAAGVAVKNILSLGLGFADAGRSARLLNEAADIAGGTHKQLGGIIEDVRRKSDIGRGRLAELGRELRIIGFDSRQTQVVLSGMAIAESALGQGAGSALKGIAEQSRAFRRLTLGARDAYGEYASLRAIGLRKADLFAELAKGTGRSVGDVQRTLGAGQISAKQGMIAIEAALRRKFGGTVQAQTISITSQFRRMREDFEGLFTGADIEPFLTSLKSITSIFSQDTASGQAFKKVVTGLLTDLGKTAEQLGPVIKEAILGLSAEAAKPGGLATTIRGWINDAKELSGAISSIVDGIKAIAGAASTIKTGFDIITSPIATAKKHQAEAEDAAFKRAFEGKESAKEATDAGRNLIAGAADGVRSGTPLLVAALRDAAKQGQAAFKAENKIQSPSKVYEADAVNLPKGAARGVQKGTPVFEQAVVDMSRAGSGGFQGPAPGSLRTGGDTYQVSVSIDSINGAIDDNMRREITRIMIQAISMARQSGPQSRAG